MNKKAFNKEKHSFHPSRCRPHPFVPPFVRLFFAVELPEEVRRRAADHIAELRSRMPEVRAGWERPEKMHITLKFIGEVAPEARSLLSGAAGRAASTLSPFRFVIKDAGAFPVRGLPRVLWLGVVDASDFLARLQKRLEDECEAVGFGREARPFHPHLTIARLRRPDGARRLAVLHQEKSFEAAEVFVDALLLIQSEPGSAGSRYTEVSRHKLGQANLL